MFTKLFKTFGVAAALVSSAFAKPVPSPPLVAPGIHSFDSWNGIQSLSGFDNFYGSNDFSGSLFQETIIEQEQIVVCHSFPVSIIQQRLLVLQEMAKRIITEQICEVETQVIVFEQFESSMSGFSRDLRRKSGRGVGYDKRISGHVGHLVGSDGSLSSDDLGFSGSNLGQQYIVPNGNNWSDSSSPASVQNAWNAVMGAVMDGHKKQSNKTQNGDSNSKANAGLNNQANSTQSANPQATAVDGLNNQSNSTQTATPKATAVDSLSNQSNSTQTATPKAKP